MEWFEEVAAATFDRSGRLVHCDGMFRRVLGLDWFTPLNLLKGETLREMAARGWYPVDSEADSLWFSIPYVSFEDGLAKYAHGLVDGIVFPIGRVMEAVSRATALRRLAEAGWYPVSGQDGAERVRLEKR